MQQVVDFCFFHSVIVYDCSVVSPHKFLKFCRVIVNLGQNTHSISHAGAIEGSLDFSDYPVLKLSAKANCLDSSVEVSGTYRKERQIFNAELSGLDVMNVLPLLPDGTLKKLRCI